MRNGERIAGAGGAVLLGALFLPWYGVDIQVADVSLAGSLSAWEALSLIDVLLAAVALIAILCALAGVAGSPTGGRAALLRCSGDIGLVLVLYRIADLPVDGAAPVASGDAFELGREPGILVALVATAAIAYGGWMERRPARPDRPATA